MYDKFYWHAQSCEMNNERHFTAQFVVMDLWGNRNNAKCMFVVKLVGKHIRFDINFYPLYLNIVKHDYNSILLF